MGGSPASGVDAFSRGMRDPLSYIFPIWYRIKRTRMKRIKNEVTGDMEVHLSGKEVRYGKWIAAAGAAVLLACIVTAGISVYAMTSMRAENDLYRNQLKLAEDKMEKLADKVAGVEKISNELQNMVGNQGQEAGTPSGTAASGGIGGAATVPDKAKDAGTDIKTPGDLLSKLVDMDEKLDQQIRLMIGLRSEIMSKSYTVHAIYQAVHDMPSIWPASGNISSGFGWRISPGGIGSSYHEGVDIAVDYGTPIHVTADGTVTRAGWVDGYGYLVEVRHADGISTRYGHNSALLVYEGQELKQGDTVALAGSTGNSTGPHCHYEVRINGAAVDPMLFLH